jgi:hypothetical protein
MAGTTALAAPISTGDTEGVGLLLTAGADPNRLPPADLYGADNADDQPWPAVYAAIRSDCPAELVEMLLERRRSGRYRSGRPVSIPARHQPGTR